MYGVNGFGIFDYWGEVSREKSVQMRWKEIGKNPMQIGKAPALITNLIAKCFVPMAIWLMPESIKFPLSLYQIGQNVNTIKSRRSRKLFTNLWSFHRDAVVLMGGDGKKFEDATWCSIMLITTTNYSFNEATWIFSFHMKVFYDVSFHLTPPSTLIFIEIDKPSPWASPLYRCFSLIS